MPTLHESAAAGDLEQVKKHLRARTSLEAYDDEGLTPLMVAVSSRNASVETVRELIRLGADVNARKCVNRKSPKSGSPFKTTGGQTVLGYAAQTASLQKIELLLESGADPTAVCQHQYSVLVNALHRDYPETPEEHCQVIARLIEAGAPLELASTYGESPVRVSAIQGRYQALKLLIEAGADPAPLKWNDLFFATGLGSVAEVRELAHDLDLLCTEDFLGRTPFLVAIHAGSLEKAKVLLDAGSDLQAEGHHGRTALACALESSQTELVKWLIEQGVDINALNGFGQPPLAAACSQNDPAIVQTLIDAGADVNWQDAAGRSLMNEASSPEVIEVLAQAGLNYDDVSPEMRRKLLGHENASLATANLPKYRLHCHRRYGRSNPEQMNNPFWDSMVRTRSNAYGASVELKVTTYDRPAFWCFDRFGQTFTRLPDGRFVEIAGEYEDYYDADFCIYNDVVVHHKDGTFQLYGYPEDVFPPTDFHTATQVGADIYVIGYLGYPDQRQPGQTPVYVLETKKFSIRRLNCTGECPGWIFNHKAILTTEGQIRISGGEVICDLKSAPVPNTKTYWLDIETRNWTCSQET